MIQLRLLIIKIIAILIGLFGLYQFMNYGFLEVSSKSPVTYSIINKAGQTIVTKQAVSTYRKFVRKGTYQVQATAGEKSFFTVTKSGGFFKTSHVDSVLVSQKSREFIGNNPNFCTHFNGSILYSYNCSELGGLTAHVPATLDLPTTTVTEQQQPYIRLKNFITYAGKDRTYVLGDEDNSAALYDIDDQLHLSNPISLRDTADAIHSNITSYKAGFILYKNDFSKLQYYKSEASTPSTLNIAVQERKVSHAVTFTTYKNDFATLFNAVSEGDDDASSGNKSEFMLYQNATTLKKFTFNKTYTSGGLCGQNEACLINNGVMDVYDVSKGKAKLNFTMNNVQNVTSFGEQTIIATNRSLYSLNLTSGNGFIAYDYGSAGFCGLSVSSTGYVICTVNSKGKSSALFINPSSSDADQIDKKIAKLLKNSDVQDISIYKNIIYISPNLGDQVYDTTTNEYTYPQSIIDSTARRINTAVAALGINTSKYTVINTYQ